MEKARETLRQAATAAKALIPIHERELAALRQVVGAWESIASLGSGNVSGGPGVRRMAATQGLRAPHGQAQAHIRAVLVDGGEVYTVNQVCDLCFQKFGATYSRDTVASLLRRGLKTGRYERRDGKWAAAKGIKQRKPA
jgi:hypothetical protein